MPGPLSRSDFRRALRGAQYPARLRELYQQACANGAPSRALGAIGELPVQYYNSLDDVMAAYCAWTGAPLPAKEREAG